MQYIKYDYDDYSVHFIKTDKFKSIFLSMVLVNKFEKEALTNNFLLRKLLTTSSKNYKNEVELCKKSYELYNSGIYVSGNMCADTIITSFDMEVLEDKYTEEGLVNKAFNHFFDVIFNTNIDNGKFEKTNYDLAVQSMIDYYDRQKEDYFSTAYKNAFKLFDEEYLKYPLSGQREDLENINEKSIVKYYYKLFNEAHANIFIIGNFDDEYMLNLINENVKGKLHKNSNPFKLPINKKIDKIKEKEDSDKNNQSILLIIYKIINPTTRELNVILPIFNRILGVGNNSKLFKHVREENSLCYDIRSIASREEELITIQSGINYKDKDKAINLIDEQLENIKNGNVEDYELEDAIKFRNRSLKQFEDENDSILSIKITSILFGSDDLQTREENLKTVTKEEIIALANKLDKNIIYTLKGDMPDEQD